MKPHKITALRAIQDHVLVTEMQFRERQLSSGIILPNDTARVRASGLDGVRYMRLVHGKNISLPANGCV